MEECGEFQVGMACPKVLVGKGTWLSREQRGDLDSWCGELVAWTAEVAGSVGLNGKIRSYSYEHLMPAALTEQPHRYTPAGSKSHLPISRLPGESVYGSVRAVLGVLSSILLQDWQ